jgi:hypothetical protein
MLREKRNELLKTFAKAPDMQIDEKFKPIFLDLVYRTDERVRDEIKKILDECARYSLASDFVMGALDLVWKDLCNLTGVDWKKEIGNDKQE